MKSPDKYLLLSFVGTIAELVEYLKRFEGMTLEQIRMANND